MRAGPSFAGVDPVDGNLSAARGSMRGGAQAQYIAILLAAFVGIGASIGAFLSVLSWEHRIVEIDFESKAKSFLGVINTNISDSSSLLYTVGAYVETNEHEVSRRQFQRFAKVLHDEVIGLRNVGWAPRVTSAQRAAFERGAFSSDEPAHGYRIAERDARGRSFYARPRPAYYPILYVETSVTYRPAEARRVFGFDLASEPVRAAAIAQAIRTRRPAATGPIKLITIRGRSGGVMAFMPVGSSRGGRSDSKNPTGVVFEVFDISVMIDSIVAKRAPDSGLNLYLFDRRGGLDNRLIYWRPSVTVANGRPAEHDLRRSLHWQSTLSMIDQRWGALITPARPVHWIDESWQAVIALVAGLAVTSAIVGYLVISLRRTILLEGLTASLRVTTEQLQHNVAHVAHMAHHDALTDLPNRLLFREHIESALARSRRDEPFAILYLDLDNFKSVNDTLGHDAGDRLLCIVAARIKGCLREVDTVARLGGDEFAILLVEEPNSERVAHVAQRLISEVGKPYAIDANRVEIGVSIGIADAGADSSVESLLKQADIALYEAKAGGRGTYRFFAQVVKRELEAQR